MESRKMVLMNLFTGNSGDADIEWDEWRERHGSIKSKIDNRWEFAV